MSARARKFGSRRELEEFHADARSLVGTFVLRQADIRNLTAAIVKRPDGRPHLVTNLQEAVSLVNSQLPLLMEECESTDLALVADLVVQKWMSRNVEVREFGNLLLKLLAVVCDALDAVEGTKVPTGVGN